MAKRQVFFSFHYDEDVWRVAQVRNIGAVEGQPLFSDNGWEKVRRTSEEAIKRWINKEMEMRSCVVVLIGTHTASRKWVKYEIEQAWKKGKGIVGIYIHRLENSCKQQADKGENPFDSFCVDRTFNFIVLWSGADSIPNIHINRISVLHASSICLDEYSLLIYA